MGHFTEYEHNNELTQRWHIDSRIWKFSQNYLVIFKNSTESRIDCVLANRGANVSFSFNAARAIIEITQK